MGSACGCQATPPLSPGISAPVQPNGRAWETPRRSKRSQARPDHVFFDSWQDVLDSKRHFLVSSPRTVHINHKPITVSSNPHGAKSHTSCMARHLTQALFEQLHNRFTRNGVTLDKCIRTGIENVGHPVIPTVGLVAGDHECYHTFRELFDVVIAEYHDGYSASEDRHLTDMDPSKCIDVSIDSKYVISTRVRSSRNLKDLPFPPSCNLEERRVAESLLVEAFEDLSGELAGEYFPLAGSSSRPDKPDGMSRHEAEELAKDHFLFAEPSSALLISSGTARDWPDARGVFHNFNKNLLVWVNEEDHARIISMQKGADMKSVFNRFVEATTLIEDSVTRLGRGFAHDEHLGFTLSCPSNLGTGLRASMMVKIPLLGARKDFKTLCKRLGLQPRGSGGSDSKFAGVYDISNAQRLGKSEVSLVNLVLEGVATLIDIEKRLEKGEKLDSGFELSQEKQVAPTGVVA